MMDAFGGDEDDRESGGSADGSSENEQDGPMDDRDDEDMNGNGALDGDGEIDGDNEDDNEEEEDEVDQNDSQYSFSDRLHRGPKPGQDSRTSSQNALSDSLRDSNGPAPTSHPNPSMFLTSPSPTQESTSSAGIEIPKLRPEVLTASVYDIVPTIAAPHSTSINAVIATPDLRWVFTGGTDGYIRKFDWLNTANGKSMLTVAQRHPFVDSVTKAGVLMSYWENNEGSNGKPADDNSSISPVYSLAVQRDGLWLLSGLESGGINLQSVRIDEGKRITRLQGHTSAVSVLNLARDERSMLSGSWDKSVIDWDLNVGKKIRKFEGSGGQISALETRPSSSLPVPEASGDIVKAETTFSTNVEAKPQGMDASGLDQASKLEPLFGDDGINGDLGSPNDSLFGGNDGDSLFGDNDNETAALSGGNFIGDEDDDFSRAIADDMREQAEGLEQNQVQDQTQSIAEPGDDTQMDDAAQPFLGTATSGEPETQIQQHSGPMNHTSPSEEVVVSSKIATNGAHYDQDGHADKQVNGNVAPETEDPPPAADSVFLAAEFDGSLRIWDKRKPTPIAKITPQNVPPWCMNATWSPDGNFIYAGRRNGTVDEYSLHKGLQGAERSFKLPNNSGPVSALRAMPNGRHLICASYDILRLYDLQEQQIFKHATVPFLIVPGHRTGVVASLYMDPTCRYLISAAGNRGWEGSTTEVLLGYEIGVPK